MKQWANTIAGAAFFSFAVVLYFLIPSQIYMIEAKHLSMSPAFYPRLVIATMAILSFIYLLLSFYKEKKKIIDPKELKISNKSVDILGENPLRTLTAMAIILGYIYLLEFAGFLIATPIGLGAFMYYMGNRRIRVLCLVMIIVPLVSYYFFQKVMLIILPGGSLFY